MNRSKLIRVSYAVLISGEFADRKNCDIPTHRQNLFLTAGR